MNDNISYETVGSKIYISFKDTCEDPPKDFILLGLVMIVKNGKKYIEQTLKSIKPYLDRWYILDTGSTDGTQEIIRRVMEGVEGKLYEEPFVDFSVSRNRILDLAGTECKYVIMLDDSYVLEKGGDIMRRMLYNSDAEYLGVKIAMKDVYHLKGIIIKTSANLRFKYRVHEAIDANFAIIDIDTVYFREFSDEERTYERLVTDYEWLEEDYKNEKNPRFLYYLGQSAQNLGWLDDAIYWYNRRIQIEDEDTLEQMFSLTRTGDIYKDKNLDKCLDYYTKGMRICPRQIEPYYETASWLLFKNPYMAYSITKAGLEVKTDELFGLTVHRMETVGLPILKIQLAYRFWDTVDLEVFDKQEMHDIVKDTEFTYAEAVEKFKDVYIALDNLENQEV